MVVGYQPIADDSKNVVQPKTYFGRFYVLAVFSFMAAHQNTTWITFGTIPQESFDYFGLTDDDITLIAAYGPIVFIILTLPFMWFVERAGLRITIVGSTWVLAIGCGIRCFVPYVSHGKTWIFLIHLGHILNAAIGLPVMVVPPRLSAIWFPPNQRTFATAVTTTAQNLGIALAFITIPYLTRTYDMHTMLYIEAEIAVFIALLASIYFPNHPPTPPSLTATVERIDFKKSIRALMKNWSFLFLAISGGIIQGACGGFSSVLSIVLNPTGGFTDKVSVKSVAQFFHSNAWLGATGSLSSYIGGQLVGLLGIKVQRRFKISLIILLAITITLAFWFAVSVYGYWHWSSSVYNVFITLCLMYFFLYGTAPLYYEACAEVTYPAPEGSSAAVLAVLINVFSLLFQIIALCHIFSNDHPERAKAMVWALAGITLLSILPVFFVKEDYKRLNIDSDKDSSSVNGSVQSK